MLDQRRRAGRAGRRAGAQPHAAQAAWWLWDELSAQTKRAVAKMVEHDTDAFIKWWSALFHSSALG
jgi:hypothetical protein